MRLLVRLKDPCVPPMVVEARFDHDFLERAHKLVLICGKIRRTMYGAAKITIDTSREYVLLESDAVIRWVLANAGTKDWQAVQYLMIPDGLMLGELGRCLVMAGMRRNQMLIDQDGLWFQGTDGTSEYVSVKVDRRGLEKLLALPVRTQQTVS
jgi:hypothetical protein